MMRLNKDLAEVDVPEEMAVCDYRELKSKKRVTMTAFPDEESFWYKGKYKFVIDFGKEYPYKPPKCMSLTNVSNG